jgi:hypothetical protein
MKKATKKRPTTTADGGHDAGFVPIAQAFQNDRDVSLGKMSGLSA